MRWTPLALLALCACAPSDPILGGFTVPLSHHLPTVKSGANPLLESYAGGGAYAAVGVQRGAKSNVEMQYGAFKFTDLPGTWDEGVRLEWSDLRASSAKGTWRNQKGEVVMNVELTSPRAGELAFTYTAADPSVNRLSLAFNCRDDDHFLGFGAQADGLDHHGHTVPIWVSEPGIGKQLENDDYPDLWMLVGTRHASSYGLPTWHSNRGYVGAVDTDRRVVFELCSVKSDAWRVEVWDNHFTLWVFADADGIPALSLAAAQVLGLPMTPPPLAFAPWNDAIFGSAEVRRVAKELRDNGIPSSAIWTEDFRGGERVGADGYRLIEDWDLDPSLYPDAPALAAELKAQGFGWLAYFNPFIVQGAKVADEATLGHHWVATASGDPYQFSGPTFKPTGLADLSRPETREWVKSHLRQALDLGFTGWMADFGEWLPADAALASGADPMEAHNAYPRDWDTLSEEVLAERASDGVQRLFFARSGALRSNEHTPVVWAGDQRTDFEPDDGLPTVVSLGLNLGLAAVSTFGHDIGGYQSATNPPATKELFFRWTTLGALSPVMRTHHGTLPGKQWRFDSDAETLAHYKRWAKFHLQLFPYLDGSSAQAEATGIPLMRALALPFPQDAACWTLSDEYMLGGSLLVAPVLEEGATQRPVHVPSGDWVMPDGTAVTGPVDVVAQAALTEIPLYYRAGAVIPRLPDTVQTVLPATGVVSLSDVKNVRSVLVVAGGAGSFAERDGTFYGSKLSDTTSYAEDGTPLTPCTSDTMRGCVDTSGPHVVVRMRKAGELTLPGQSVLIDESDAPADVSRTYDVELLRAR